jgi:tetratricopeptide (TPR) repeat protein
VSKPTIKSGKAKPCFNPWSLSIYVYWFIILFFIAATFYILGRAHTNQSNITPAMEVTEETLLQAADFYNSGKTKMLAGELDAAIADLSAAIDAGAASVDTYILRGEAYMQSGDYRNAMADFNVVLAKDPANGVAYYDRSLLNMRLEDYDAALNDINNALAANTSNPSPVLQMRDLYAKRGQLNLWMKNWQGAIADYTNSLARPEGTVNPNVYAERAEAYTALGNYTDAINDYSSAIRVISEQIQGAPTMEERELLSSRAMNYFEKSAALNLNLGNIDASRTDLESAYTIAVALNDAETADRMQSLIAELNTPIAPVEEPAATATVETETATTETATTETAEKPAETETVEQNQ